jgi:hypothetical protein
LFFRIGAATPILYPFLYPSRKLGMANRPFPRLDVVALAMLGSRTGVADAGLRSRSPNGEARTKRLSGLARKFAHVCGVRTHVLRPGKQARVRRPRGRLRLVQGGRAGLDRRRARSRLNAGAAGVPLDAPSPRHITGRVLRDTRRRRRRDRRHMQAECPQGVPQLRRRRPAAWPLAS